jgi:predicted lipoprotein with Yx(FWY)xxD motif
MKRSSLMFGVLAVCATAIAGCGSGGASSSSSATAAAPASATSNAATSPSTTAASGAARAVTVTTKHAGKLGTILAAGPGRLSVYLFEADHGSTSACSGACAAAWPPVTTSGPPVARGAAVAADLGTVARSDGAQQVTYKGHPLYYFKRDQDAGDSYGQGVTAFGAAWYLLSSSGAKVDNS